VDVELEGEDGAVVLLLCCGAATEDSLEGWEDSEEVFSEEDCEFSLEEDSADSDEEFCEFSLETLVEDSDEDREFSLEEDSVDSDDSEAFSEEDCELSLEEDSVDSDDSEVFDELDEEVFSEEDCEFSLEEDSVDSDEEFCEFSLETSVEDSDEDCELSELQVRWHDWSVADSDGATEGAVVDVSRSQGRDTSETVTFSSAVRVAMLSSLTWVSVPLLAQ